MVLGLHWGLEPMRSVPEESEEAVNGQYCDGCPDPMACAINGCQGPPGPSLDFALAEALGKEVADLRAKLSVSEAECERLRLEVEALRSAARVVVNADTYVDRSRSRAEAVSEAICKLERLLPEPEPRCAVVEYLEKESKNG